MATPPPGPNPYGQPQPPQGGYGSPQQQPPAQPGYGYPQQPPQPQAGGPGYGYPQQGGFQQQPGAYPPPAPGYPQGGGFAPPPPAKRGFSRLAVRLGILGVLIVIGVVVGIFNSDDSQSVSAGDCVQNTGTDNSPNLKQRDCSDSQATYKVLKKVTGTSDAKSTCENVPGSEAGFYETENGSSFVLCLGPNK